MISIQSKIRPESLRAAACYALAATVLWAPFPLGSNRPWSWSLLAMLVSVAFLIWVLSIWKNTDEVTANFKPVLGPIFLAGIVLLWALYQATPFSPRDWSHPVWEILQNARLGSNHYISINPWLTLTECIKLATYFVAAMLSYQLGRDRDMARRLSKLIALTCAFYIVYAFALFFFHSYQYQLFYAGPVVVTGPLAGPFVQRNSFAAFAGITALLALSQLVSEMPTYSFTAGKWKRSLESMLSYLLGRGSQWLIAFVLALSAVIATGSRAGAFSALCALVAFIAHDALVLRRRPAGRSRVAAALIAFAILAVLIVANGSMLFDRLSELLESGEAFHARAMLWAAALRMIKDSPFLGLGLGTFRDAYPLYADHVIPYIVDKAHNDYLELAAGLGIPAAVLWLIALVWLIGICVVGSFNRRRDRQYSVLAVAVSVLVGVHSAFDFILQMPAISLLYAVILALGVAQSSRSQPQVYAEIQTIRAPTTKPSSTR